MADSKGQYLLAIEPIPTPLAKSDPHYFPGYFVGSTAPTNIENGVNAVENPQIYVKQIAEFFSQHPEEREILIVVHGYNTSLGNYMGCEPNSGGVKGWYESIRNHIADHCSRPKGLVFLGYRWSSEVIQGIEDDSFNKKVQYALCSLPKLLNILLISSVIGAVAGAISFFTKLSSPIVFGITSVVILSLSLIIASLILTLIALRLSGYFRDSYRANHYGVPDLVELIRQLDKAIMEASPGEAIQDKERYWKNPATQPIKLSFIGHSMGGFAVTNAVRVLSDVFDQESIGSFDIKDKEKVPSSRIGHVFSLGRLILVAPDIPAESIISGRANFLSSSLRRFQEAYLFSNEGDMALRLASTAANYFSFPAKTRAGGYRLGNVVIREHREALRSKPQKQFGIVNLDENGQLLNVQPRGDGGFETKKILETPEYKGAQIALETSSFLNYLFVLSDKPLAKRQSEILLAPNRKPIAELFTYFDCTDYIEIYPQRANGRLKRRGVLSHAQGKPALSFWDYVWLTFDFATGKIDTHGGYFNNGDANDPQKAGKKWTKPEAELTKKLIYGLACLGFQGLLESMMDEAQGMGHNELQRQAALQEFSRQCNARGIQVLLAVERYNRDILQVRSETDRDGY
jgi:pimeloyl-ACP methyl ester carboxylesterase